MSRRTYDEIIAGTVPDLDSSFRPTEAQKRDSREGNYVKDDAAALVGRVREALTAAGHAGVSVEVDGGSVALRGAVADIALVNQIEGIVRGVEGVQQIDNRLHVG